MLISEILKKQNRPIETIGHAQTMQEAIDHLCEKKIGSLVVLSDDRRMVGIITERDVLCASYSRSRRPERVQVEEIMTPNPVCGSAEDSALALLQVMTDNRVRHLPIMRDGKLEGLVSIGDLVAGQLEEIREENHHLKEYIQTSGAVTP